MIGGGQFGEVYLADRYVKRPSGKTALERCAVKMLRNNATPADKTEFLREAETMLRLEHPNLVSIVGVAVQQAPWLVVLEFMQYGDLRSVLQGCQQKSVTATRLEQLHIMHQLSSGCAHMAAKRFVHMDLAARNCLVGSGLSVKVADFGLVRFVVTVRVCGY